MKIVKPLRLSLLNRRFRWEGKTIWVYRLLLLCTQPGFSA